MNRRDKQRAEREAEDRAELLEQGRRNVSAAAGLTAAQAKYRRRASEKRSQTGRNAPKKIDRI
jgi:hypothetical protein